MGIWSQVKASARAVKDFAISFFKDVAARVPDEDALGALDDIKEIAFDVVMGTLALTRSGAFNAVEVALEIKDSASPFVAKWAERFQSLTLEEIIARYDEDELARYLAVARVAVKVAEKFGGPEMLPATRLINGAIEWALIALTADEVVASIPKKVNEG